MRTPKRQYKKETYNGYTVEIHRRIGYWTYKTYIKSFIILWIAELLTARWFSAPFLLTILAHVLTFFIMDLIKSTVVRAIQTAQFVKIKLQLDNKKLPKQGKIVDYFWDVEYAIVYYSSDERPEEYRKVFN